MILTQPSKMKNKQSHKIESDNTKTNSIHVLSKQAWQKISPVWPLKTFISRNPLQGLEHLSFEEALKQSNYYFEQTSLPPEMEAINRETIKWCQAFFDHGQATFVMPDRHLGFYRSWKKLAIYDPRIHGQNSEKLHWLMGLEENAESAIVTCLNCLNPKESQREKILSYLLTTIPGWAGYIKYLVEWSSALSLSKIPVTLQDFLAIRLVLGCLLWPKMAHSPVITQQEKMNYIPLINQLLKVKNKEEIYKNQLLSFLKTKGIQMVAKHNNNKPETQIVFCIDTRSEPLRRALEAQGNYETIGFAGFFGLPVNIFDYDLKQAFPSCPVLMKPEDTIEETVNCSPQQSERDKQRIGIQTKIKLFYQSLKYNFVTPFALVEILGPWCGLWMLAKTLNPLWALKLKGIASNLIRSELPRVPHLAPTENTRGISLMKQCTYAENALRMMGLTHKFAPLVVFCGHGSETQNNAYASALDCGACGGRHGGMNAQLLSIILNQENVRNELTRRNINIPNNTHFLAAEHNTTTDEVTIFSNETLLEEGKLILKKLTSDLHLARHKVAKWRSHRMGYKGRRFLEHTRKRSMDWAQTRPEWGLAGNASFIIGPRSLTKEINLNGRAFLHSYDWQNDTNGWQLEIIMIAPLIVAQWINSQYFFSTLNNIAYGSGSKITHNLTGKIGIMQGNASDLMHGLPLQSVCIKDQIPFHEPLRLLAVVYAPVDRVELIIKKQEILQKLFGNSWMSLIVFDPTDKDSAAYSLKTDLTFGKVS